MNNTAGSTDTKPVIVFVYGTLKGMRTGAFLGEDVTKDFYLLFDGGFPMAMELTDPLAAGFNETGRIAGQTYQVSEHVLAGLDDYEGCDPSDAEDSFYIRKEVPLQSGRTAWMYLGQQAKTRFVERGVLVVPDEHGNLAWN